MALKSVIIRRDCCPENFSRKSASRKNFAWLREFMKQPRLRRQSRHRIVNRRPKRRPRRETGGQQTLLLPGAMGFETPDPAAGSAGIGHLPCHA
jgi:hypothetical protein